MKLIILLSILCITTCWPAAEKNKPIVKSCYQQELTGAAPDNETLISPFFLFN